MHLRYCTNRGKRVKPVIRKPMKAFYPLLLLLCCISCTSGEYYTLDDFSAVRKVDTHTHPNTENTAMAEQAKEDNFIILAVNVDHIYYI